MTLKHRLRERWASLKERLNGTFAGAMLESQSGAAYTVTVLVPLICVALYVTALRSPGYVSDAQMVIERDALSSMPSIDLGIFSGGSSHLNDALVIESYILSRALLEKLDAELDLRGHYSDPAWDRFSRLPADASREDLLKFYRSRVKVRVNGDSLIIDLRVQAYTPEFAHVLAEAIVRRAEIFVNEISQTLAREQMAFIERELESANQRLRQASNDLVTLQRQNEVFSPEAETETLSAIIAGLQSELASRRAELTSLRGYLNDNAPEVIALRRRISGLERQLDAERAKQVGRGQQGLGDLALKFQEAQMAVRVATDAYQVGLKTLETTRIEASRKAKHLVQVSSPSLPEEAAIPRTGYTILTAFVLLHLLYFVLMLIVATIRDHRD